ncbi:citrinin biosynthesis oxidoreductase CtnB [Colletotrichum navitas]|uniref:Citrinin biosynthesis oxidoreductase CtnB n=1 Tax=Colletotrichum navitas TaxID=681940 RepID=A0AAD8PTT0_9PEZI|nr:citrinin biosynthesis oxidoreductase CtnB [Colletotrichum navitas]KAK1580579.1 citrinin biosynthesis oxidoreductase CtnB [Colletotrichum navitas]
MASPSVDTTISLPRILCLHGGGTNAAIFKAQCRGLRRALSASFRLVFADGPFLCDPHPDIIPIYGGDGPFRRWLRWRASDGYVDAHTTIRLIHRQLSNAMEADDRLGGTGDWVGVLGFSQGASICASYLWTQQALSGQPMISNSKWRFGILLAGRPPLVALDERVKLPVGINTADAVASEFRYWPDGSGLGHVLRVPTLHVHGTADPGLEQHRRLLNQYCDPSTVRLVEWDGAHRVPLKKADVDAVARIIVDLAQEAESTI